MQLNQEDSVILSEDALGTSQDRQLGTLDINLDEVGTALWEKLIQCR